ncbi:MAG TPA: hypothetical protein VG148_00980 [Pyrinomonadaceae bacterium]|nr:hypothetical protein [Pyrinomonadaceae bacterium]
MSDEFDLNERRFVLSSNSAGADAAAGGTVFHFRQRGRVVWATYEGGGIELGLFLAKSEGGDRLDFRFEQVTAAGEFRTGRGVSSVEDLGGGRLRLRDLWEYTSGGTGSGEAVLEEV